MTLAEENQTIDLGLKLKGEIKENFNQDKAELLLTLKKGIDEFKKRGNLPEWHTICIDTSTLTRYVAYGTLDSFPGATRNNGWVNLYNRVTYHMEKIATKRGSSWIISPSTVNELKKLLEKETDEEEVIEGKDGIDGVLTNDPNMIKLHKEYQSQKFKKESDIDDQNIVRSLEHQKNLLYELEPSLIEKDDISINFNQFISTKTIYQCTKCEKTFDSMEEIIDHLSELPLKYFLKK